MKKNRSNIKNILVLVIAGMFLTGALLPMVTARKTSVDWVKGFDKGIPWQPFVPLKKTTFVGFDKESYVDDYAYLASIPASVFSDGEKLFANPLLFFQPKDTYPEDDEYRFLNDYQGTKYLMEDWMGYCDGKLDKLTTINVDKNDLDSSWTARKTISINSDDPYEIASEMALNEWSYSDNAVVAVIEKDFEKPQDTVTTGSISGEISGSIGTDRITVPRTFTIAPEFEEFTVEDQYKYVQADLWYPAIVYHSLALKAMPGFPKGIITIPSVDPDLQLYCKYEGDWLQTAASSEMTITEGPHEKCFSYVYTPGEWRVGVTNMPTEGPSTPTISHDLPLGKITVYGGTLDAILNSLGREVKNFVCDITKYPGLEKEIEDLPAFGCRNAKFELTWNDPNIDLGLTVIGPSGEELDSVMEEGVDSQIIQFDRLGECLPGEHYKVVVFALQDIDHPIDFKVEYSWEQNITKEEGDLIASACEGAVIGSTLNAPLLYVSPSKIPKVTENVLYKLGVKNLYVVDLGGYLSKENINKLSSIANVKKHFTGYKETYDFIRERTGSNDVIFSTIDPWSYWMYNETTSGLKPYGDYNKAFYFAPGAYAAAFHGSPLLLVDNHPELSGAVMWHTEFWRKTADTRDFPGIAPMFLTGSRVYDFLKKYGFDKEGPESILTVAGQYEIGPTWSRVFAGVANPGCIIGTPVDTTNWISRNIFYPALIFENPATKDVPVTLENGSVSKRMQPTLLRPLKGLWTRLFSKPFGSNLKIIKPSMKEEFIHPVLHTYGCYGYRFNERGSKYWGVYYQTRNGIIPGVSKSNFDIDEGTRLKFEGLPGAYHPDIDESGITPFYAKKAGYSNAYSTNFDIVMENLNQGVISWYMVLHGYHGGAGMLSWYSPKSVEELFTQIGLPSILGKMAQFALGVPLGLYPTTEVNPWRGYDQLWGSTEEPDSATLNAEVGLILGILGLANPDGPLKGGFLKTGLDLVPTNIPLFKKNRQDYFDGLVGPFSITAMLTKFHFAHPSAEVDDKLGNLHSMNFHADSCLIANTYLEIAMMRHGAVMQEIDPWSTSYWGGVAFQETPKDYALGETVGESYAKGRCTIGIKYLFEEGEKREWWWDIAENTVLYADPNLRIWVPSTEWDDQARNHWEKKDVEPLAYEEELTINGHAPFEVAKYPHETQPKSFLGQYLLVIILVIIIILVLIGIGMKTRKSKKKK